MASIPFWWVRVFSGVMITAGTLCLLANLLATWKSPARATAPELKPAAA
jgi:hypothetical protein